MQDENICTTCGHDKWSHAISLKGVVGGCLKETIKGWEYCSCQKFTPPNKAFTRRAKVGVQKVSSKSKKVAKPARG